VDMSKLRRELSKGMTSSDKSPLSCPKGCTVLKYSGNVVGTAVIGCSQENDTRCSVHDIVVTIVQAVGGEEQCLLDYEPAETVRNKDQSSVILFSLLSALFDSVDVDTHTF